MWYKLGKIFKNLSYLQIIYIFFVDYRSNCVKNLSAISFILKIYVRFLRKKLYVLVWIPLEIRTNFNKTKIFNKYFA